MTNKEGNIRFLIIMPWGRVGSNLVMRAMHQKSNQAFGYRSCKFNNETLNKISGSARQLRHLYDFFDDEGMRVIGSKQSIRAMESPGELLAHLAERGIVFVRMFRENVVKAAISQIRAEKYARHTQRTEGQSRWAVPKGGQPLGATEIDLDLLNQRIEMMASAHQLFQEVSGGLPRSIDIEYEALNADPRGTIASVFLQLGFDNRPIDLAYSKATPDNLRTAISNFDTIAEALEPRHRAMLHA